MQQAPGNLNDSATFDSVRRDSQPSNMIILNPKDITLQSTGRSLHSPDFVKAPSALSPFGAGASDQQSGSKRTSTNYNFSPPPSVASDRRQLVDAISKTHVDSTIPPQQEARKPSRAGSSSAQQMIVPNGNVLLRQNSFGGLNEQLAPAARTSPVTAPKHGQAAIQKKSAEQNPLNPRAAGPKPASPSFEKL